MIVGEGISQMHPTPGDATAEVSYEVNADQIGKIKRSNVFFDATAIDAASMMDVGSLLQILSANRFYPLDIKSVNVQVKILDKRNTAQIDPIFIKQSEYGRARRWTWAWCCGRIRPTASPRRSASRSRHRARRQGDPPGARRRNAEHDADGRPGGPPMMDELRRDGPHTWATQRLPTPITSSSSWTNTSSASETTRWSCSLCARRRSTSRARSFRPAEHDSDVMKSSRNSGLRMERDEVKQLFTDDAIVRASPGCRSASSTRVQASCGSAIGAGGSAVDIGSTSSPSSGSDDSGAVSFDPSEPMMAPMASGCVGGRPRKPAPDDQPAPPAPRGGARQG